MNNSKDIGINISGLIQNMLDSGFDDKDSLAEFIDNSFGALASKVNIHIDTETNQIIITDNGSGMTKEVLASACVLHNRTKASDDKQGCFGIGGKHAMVHFTQHDGKTRTVTKSLTSDFFEVEIDWKEVIETNSLVSKPHGLTMEGKKLWDTYCNGYENGTMIVLHSNEKMVSNLAKFIKEKENNNAILYFGVMYYLYLEKNRSINFIVKTKEKEEMYPVIGFDPLFYQDDRIPKDHKTMYTIEVWKDKVSGKTRAYFENRKKEKVYLNTWKNSKNPLQVKEAPSENYEFYDTVCIYSSYSTIWEEIQEPFFNEWTKCKTENIDHANGRYFLRIDKIIDKVTIPAPTSGDTWRYPIVKNSRHTIYFTTKLDRDFKIQINKSHIHTDQIDEHIYSTILYLNKCFVDDMIKIYKPKSVPEPSSPKVPEPSSPKVPEPKVPEPKVPEPKVPEPSSPKVPEPSSPKVPEPKVTVQPVHEPKVNVQPVPETKVTVQPVPEPSSPKVPEPPYDYINDDTSDTELLKSISITDCIQKIKILHSKLNKINYEKSVKHSCKIKDSDLSYIEDSIKNIENFITKYV
jgi:hypothetical protein